MLSLVILAVGTFGYVLIEGWDILDAIYMTVITLTTVGYGEVHEVSKLGRLFTIVLIFAGTGFVLYLAGTIVQIMVEGQIRSILGRKLLDKKIDQKPNFFVLLETRQASRS